jgi:hypothetical protein
MNDIEVVDDLPKPVDMLVAGLAVVLLAVGIILIVMSGSDSPDYRRVPVTSPQTLISYGITREG